MKENEYVSHPRNESSKQKPSRVSHPNTIKPFSERERIYRKTFEVIDRPLHLTHVKKRRRSPIFAKCEDLMEILWNDGYRKEIPWKDLRYYVESVCGGFRTTIADYLGKRATYYKGRGREGVLKNVGKPGYLERFGFIKRKNRVLVTLLHRNVDRSYHYLQTNMVSFSHTFSRKDGTLEKGALAPILHDYSTTTTESEREIRETESNLTASELQILRAAKGEGGS